MARIMGGVEMITITSVEVKDPRGQPLSDDEINNGITVKFDYKAFMEGAKNTEQQVQAVPTDSLT